MALQRYNWLAKILLGILLLAAQTNVDNFGFALPANAEAIGYDLWGLFVWVAGAYLVYAGVRDWKNQKKAS